MQKVSHSLRDCKLHEPFVLMCTESQMGGVYHTRQYSESAKKYLREQLVNLCFD